MAVLDLVRPTNGLPADPGAEMTTLADVIGAHRPARLGRDHAYITCGISCEQTFPDSTAWAEHVAEMITAAGLIAIPAVQPGGTVPIPLIRTIRKAASEYWTPEHGCDARELHAAHYIADEIVASATHPRRRHE